MQTAATLPTLHQAHSPSQPRPTIREELLARQPLLARVAIGHLVLIPFALILLLIDTRLVAGEPPWIKPLKFDLSIAIYSLTMAWVLGPLSLALKTSVSRRIAAAMWIETAIIALQAARGVRSHFNVAAPFDIVCFQIMGLAILYNTWQIVRVLRAYLSADTAHIPAAQRRAMQLGLISLLIGSVLGGYMSAHMAHSVGVADGGPGLPLFGWSTRGGDLRIGHFLGLHGIQLLIFIQAWMGTRRVAPLRQQQLLWLAFTLHAVATLALFALALRGLPLISLN